MNEHASHQQRHSTAVPANTKLGIAMRALLSVSPGAHLTEQVNRVADEIVEAMNRDEVEQAADAVASIVALEAEADHADIKREYGIALRRLLTDRHLNRWAALMVDAFLTDALRAVMVRAGVDGTKVLLHHLSEAETIVERRIYFETLCATEEGTHLAIRLFDDHRWFVVRNVAELAGELKIAQAVAALGKALHHDDARVRQSAVSALARIGSPATEEHLRSTLKEGDKELRYVIARSVQGKGAAALVMPIVLAAEKESDQELKKELHRALGRIGTPDAIQALIEAAAPGGRVFGKKPAGPRVAAVQALKTAAGPKARNAFEALRDDHDKTVRSEVLHALESLSSD
jgi:hypothetical protein